MKQRIIELIKNCDDGAKLELILYFIEKFLATKDNSKEGRILLKQSQLLKEVKD